MLLIAPAKSVMSAEPSMPDQCHMRLHKGSGLFLLPFVEHMIPFNNEGLQTDTSYQDYNLYTYVKMKTIGLWESGDVYE